MPAQAKLSLWKRVFLTNKDLETSNLHLNKIKKFSGHSVTLLKSFEEISKNVGVSFLILDPTESQLQILHHGHVLRGNRSSATKKLVTILGADPEAKPIHIAQKLIKNIKEKSFCFDEFAANVDKEEDFTNLDVPNLDFQFKNILPIPIFLTKVFIQLQSTTPYEVAKAFIRSISDLESSQMLVDTSNSPDDKTTEEDREMEGDLADINHETDLPKFRLVLLTSSYLMTSCMPFNFVTFASLERSHQSFTHCHLIKKLQTVLSQYNNYMEKNPLSNKRTNPSTPNSDSDSKISSPDNIISKKDHYLINTMIKLHDTMDKSLKTKEEKEPGFKHLESHRKKILNASASSPFPTEAPALRKANSKLKTCQSTDSIQTKSPSTPTQHSSQTSGIANFSGFCSIHHLA